MEQPPSVQTAEDRAVDEACNAMKAITHKYSQMQTEVRAKIRAGWMLDFLDEINTLLDEHSDDVGVVPKLRGKNAVKRTVVNPDAVPLTADELAEMAEAGQDQQEDDEDDEEDDEDADKKGGHKVPWIDKVPSMLADWSVSETVKYIDNLHETETIPMRECPPADQSPYLRPGFKATKEQLHSLACIRRARTTSKHRGLVLGDPPGEGKSLPVILAAAEGKKPGSGPMLFIVPAHLCNQWEQEFEKFLKPGHLRVFVLRNSNVTPQQLFKYDVVIVSYQHLSAELGRIQKYYRDIRRYKKNEELQVAPRRPSVTILAQMNSWGKGFHELMVLDEPQACKNTGSLTAQAVHLVRKKGHTVPILLTGTPVENTWEDLFGLAVFMSGHNITMRARFNKIFTGYHSAKDLELLDDQKVFEPRGHYRKRLLKFAQSFILCQVPSEESVYAPKKLGILFAISKQDKDMSDEAFDLWKQSGGNEERGSFKKFGQFHVAKQRAQHPELHNIMAIVREAFERKAMAGGLYSAAHQQLLVEWWQTLREDARYRSPLIDRIRSVVKQVISAHPGEAIVIVEESVFVLDIVQAMVEDLDYGPKTLLYNGRMSQAEKDRALAEFNAYQGSIVLLLSRTAGATGLNLQRANHIVLCSQWIKQAAIDQTIARVARKGQTRPVTVYLCLANNAKVEAWISRRRNKKRRVCNALMGEIQYVYDPTHF